MGNQNKTNNQQQQQCSLLPSSLSPLPSPPPPRRSATHSTTVRITLEAQPDELTVLMGLARARSSSISSTLAMRMRLLPSLCALAASEPTVSQSRFTMSSPLKTTLAHANRTSVNGALTQETN